MMLDADLKQLIDYYARLGYLAVRITPEVVRTPDLSKIRLVYHIEEGVQYQVAAVQIDNNQSYPKEIFQDLTEMKAGQLDDGIVKSDMRQMENYLGYRGIRAQVDKQVFEDPNNPGLVRVHYVMQGDRGAPDRVGRVIIEGNSVTQDRVILNQVGLRPGQILQYPLLEDARMRLTHSAFSTRPTRRVSRCCPANSTTCSRTSSFT